MIMIKEIAYKIVFLLFGIIILVIDSFAQSFQYKSDQLGKFIFDNRLVRYPGVDVTALQKNLVAIVEWVHQNDEVINHPSGFDALVDMTGLFGDNKIKKEGFGMRSFISYSFNYFYIENGVSKRATGNTAHSTEVFINSPIYYISTQFDEAEFKTDDPPHLKKALEEARENLRNYFTTAPIIKEIAPGVRLYAPSQGTWFKGILLVFNPDRPDIWIPVTVKEIMEVKLAYYKVKHEIDSINYEKMVASWAKMNFNPDPEHTMRPQLYQRIQQEYENFTTEELSLPAYSGANEESGISKINARSEGRAVVKFNPACWDRSLPAAAVQYMSWRYRPESELELEKFKPRNGGLTDFEGMFFNSLPVEKMGVLIEKR